MPRIIRELSPDRETITAAAALNPGDIVQTPDGLAAIVCGNKPYAIGELVPVQTDAIVSVPSAAATTIAAGARAGFDNTGKLAVSTAGDFALGGAYVAKTNGQTAMVVRLNRQKIT